jgi:hypothetical protein
MGKVLVKRSDPIYIEIENFKEYELTNNIAYEMAIRNEKVAQLKKRTDQLIEANFGEITTDEEYEKRVEYMKNEFDGSELDVIDKLLRDEFYITTFTGYSLKEFDKSFGYPGPKRFQIAEGQETKIRLYLNEIMDSIMPDMARPYVLPPEKMDKRVPIFLNLALPLDEITSFVSSIKNQFDENHKLVTTHIELLGTELEKADIHSVRNRNGRILDAKDTLSMKYKTADMFFIYDALKNNMSKIEIKYEIYDHYKTKSKDRPLDDKTLYKYRDIATEYIENLKYKELVTGFILN